MDPSWASAVLVASQGARLRADASTTSRPDVAAWSWRGSGKARGGRVPPAAPPAASRVAAPDVDALLARTNRITPEAPVVPARPGVPAGRPPEPDATSSDHLRRTLALGELSRLVLEGE